MRSVRSREALRLRRRSLRVLLRPVHGVTCFLAEFSDKPCEGRHVRVHLIPKQLIRRELGKGWRTIADDPRCWVWACGGAMGPSGHHGMLDYTREIRIPRSALPAGVELFALEHGLTWWLTREYGPSELDELAA